jgi:hypothetical protein
VLAWMEYHEKLSGWAQFIGAMLALTLTYSRRFHLHGSDGSNLNRRVLDCYRMAMRPSKATIALRRTSCRLSFRCNLHR